MIYLKKKKQHIFILLLKMIWNGEGRPSFAPFQSGRGQKKAGPTLGCGAAVLLANDGRFECPL